MKIKLGTIEFEAKPYEPRDPPRSLFSLQSSFRSYFENIDWELRQKSNRIIYFYDCRTKVEKRYAINANDQVTLETDLFAFFPSKQDPSAPKIPPRNRPKKAKKFAEAAAKAAGLSGLDGLNTALQSALASFKVTVPIAKFKAGFPPDTSFSIHAKIEYRHFLLSVPGQRLRGYLFVSFPYAVQFHSSFQRYCVKPKKGDPIPSRFDDPPRPLLPDDLGTLGVTSDAFKDHRAKVENHIEWLRKREQEERERPLTEGLTEKKVKKEKDFRDYLAKIFSDAVARHKKELEAFDKALREKKAALGGG